MYHCQGCGAGMRFDIASQKLVCDYCGSSCAVEEHPNQIADAQKTEYETTVFSCPMCGGEITSADNAATDFCPFCGSSVVLEGRMVNEKKPKYIIPFSMTKEKSGKQYMNAVKKAWCIPKELKQEEYLQKFQGIYMPSWNYDVSMTGRPHVGATRMLSDRVENYTVDFTVDGQYCGILHDAASHFDDDIAEDIGKYPPASRKPFSAAYLSGFYADSPDVDSDVYEQDAIEESLASLNRRVTSKDKKLQGMFLQKINSNYHSGNPFVAKAQDVALALVPVWFLTWRKKDRVAYGVVNGTTGKVNADLPVDIGRYLLISLLFAIPFAALYWIMPTMAADAGLTYALLISIFVLFANRDVLVHLAIRESHSLDKGYAKQIGSKVRELGAKLNRKYTMSLTKLFVICAVIIGIIILLCQFRPVLQLVSFCAPYICFLIIVITLPGTVKAAKLVRSGRIITETLVMLGLFAAAAVIRIINPVDDLWFYLGTILVLLGLCFGTVFLIRRYNALCTRPLPEYHERGGAAA